MTAQKAANQPAGTLLGNPPPGAEPGLAPRMQVRSTSAGSGGPRTWVLVFRGDDEIMSGLTDFAKENGLKGGHLSGIGALQSAQLAFFDRAKLDYVSIPIDDQVECLSLSGTIGLADGKPLLHVHCVAGFPDGTVRGGHVVRATVWPTLEMFLTESTEPLLKPKDDESGLELSSFDQ